MAEGDLGLPATASVGFVTGGQGANTVALAAARHHGLTFHDLRRANATGMVVEGVDLKTAQTRLGHSDPRLTLAIYAQATSEADQEAARRLGARFMPSRDQLARDGPRMRASARRTARAPQRH